MSRLSEAQPHFVRFDTFITKLTFTRPKAGREIRPLNWTQEHKSVLYSPPSKATATPPGQRAIGPCQSRTLGQHAGVCAN